MVPDSPRVNGNAAAVCVLLHLIATAEGLALASWRVRCPFASAEEIADVAGRTIHRLRQRV